MELIYIIISTLIVSLVSLIGIFFIKIKKNKQSKFISFFVILSCGIFLANVFFHLLPESFELYNENLKYEENHLEHEDEHLEHEEGNLEHEDEHLEHEDEHTHEHKFNLLNPSIFVFIGLIFFFIVEKLSLWHHHHSKNCNHHLSKKIIIGDGLHNLVDGFIIATAFLVDLRLGILTTFSIAIHEIPQEICDFSLLLHSGLSKIKAILFNFTSALLALIGGFIGYFIGNKFEIIIPFLIAFSAGNFLYLALVDLLPNISKNKINIKEILIFCLGIVLILIFNLI